MMRLGALLRRPISWVLAAALAAALLVFQDYGLTWDEPLFYRYADALGYAYTPANWTSGHFDLTQSYGPSGDDHKTRGPGYLLLARLPAGVLQAAGMSIANSWHLINSFMFVFGVFFVYGLARRFTGELGAALGALLFATQPMLWGHAFINPKDVPFMVFFSGTVWFGWRMVDRSMSDPDTPAGQRFKALVLPAVFLGLASSNRVLGPFAGLLVAMYWLARSASRRRRAWLVPYAGLGATVMFVTWPYLWENPLNFPRVLALMADNPTVLPVLFAGQVYTANALPVRYLPFYLAATLTEPVWPLAVLGSIAVRLRGKRDQETRSPLVLLLIWLAVPIAYVLLLHPPMYDGMRHFLFILPPAFALAAAGAQELVSRLRAVAGRAVLIAIMIAPGLWGISRLHPYEYAYFNAVAGGTGGAFRHYETDYWLTCYKDAVKELQLAAPNATRLFVHREAEVAAPYASRGLVVIDERDHRNEIGAGDFVLVNTRTNEDLHTFRDAPEVLTVGRLGATFCVVKRVP